MLKQILKDMFVDPDILAELPEEQKQILFFKIREEQIRRYNEHDKEFSKKARKKASKEKKKDSPNKIRILEDSNGQPWTWIMGEHPDDVSIEELWSNLGKENPTSRTTTRKENSENASPASKVQTIIQSRNKALHKDNSTENEIHKKTLESTKNSNSNNNNSNANGTAFATSETVIKPKPLTPQKPKRAEPKISKPDVNKSPQTPAKNITTTPIIPASTTSKPTVPENKPRIPPRAPVTPPKPTPAGDRVPPAPPSHTVTQGKGITGTTPDTRRISDEEDVYERMDQIADFLPVRELEEKDWQTQLRRFKAADENRKSHARRASMEVKRLSQKDLLRGQKLERLRANFQRKRSQREMNAPASAKRPTLPPKPTNLRPKHPAVRPGRLPKPASRDEVLEWFKEIQAAEILASVDDNNHLPDWFHGLVSRFKAEQLLENRPVGDYLIRVSEKIWGYALSYKFEGKIKHFLIDASEPNCYHFFGNDQIRHPGLEQLIAFHQDEPITYGGEILKTPVGQLNPKEPDYADLIELVHSSHHINKVTTDTAL